MTRPDDQDMGSLSIPVPLQEIGPGGRAVTFSPTDEDKAGLAKRFGLRKILALGVEGRLMLGADGEVLFRGKIAAEVEQTCVVTLDPVRNKIDEPLLLRFVPADRLAAPAREVQIDADEDEEVEAVTGDLVDLGPAVAEQFGVALDPYPRKPGAALSEAFSVPESGGSTEDSGSRSPFAILRNLRSGG